VSHAFLHQHLSPRTLSTFSVPVRGVLPSTAFRSPTHSHRCNFEFLFSCLSEPSLHLSRDCLFPSRRATDNTKFVSPRLWAPFSALPSSILFKPQPCYRPFTPSCIYRPRVSIICSCYLTLTIRPRLQRSQCLLDDLYLGMTFPFPFSPSR
jgi:hypothetical protein